MAPYCNNRQSVLQYTDPGCQSFAQQQSDRCIFSYRSSLTPPVIGLDKPCHLMHCKQRSYDNNHTAGKHVVMVHTIQTHDIQTELIAFNHVHLPKTKTKLDEFEEGKSMSKATRQAITDSILVNMYNMFVQWSFYILLTLVRT